MSDIDPWRDPSYYQQGRIVKCHGCKQECYESHWGKWCFKCNVERIERITKSLTDLANGR